MKRQPNNAFAAVTGALFLAGMVVAVYRLRPRSKLRVGWIRYETCRWQGFCVPGRRNGVTDGGLSTLFGCWRADRPGVASRTPL